MNKPDVRSLRIGLQVHEALEGAAPIITIRAAELKNLVDYIDGLPEPKVTLEQVREFVESDVNGDGLLTLRQIIDFIDNGPPKPDPNQILAQIRERNRGKYNIDVFYAQRDALREAGLLKETT